MTCRRRRHADHQYGPHIFHTNSDEVVDYLSQFTEWRPYEHRVLATVRDQLVPIPINRTTMNMLYGTRPARPTRRRPRISPRAPSRSTIRTSEDVVINAVGRELYELFFRGYTRKQWGLDPCRARQAGDRPDPDPHQHRRPLFRRQVPGHAAARLHRDVRADARPSAHRVAPGPTIADVRGDVDAGHIIYTGPIDEYFDLRFGKLPYRSLRFDHQTLDAGAVPAGRGGQLSRARTCPSRGSANIST